MCRLAVEEASQGSPLQGVRVCRPGACSRACLSQDPYVGKCQVSDAGHSCTAICRLRYRAASASILILAQKTRGDGANGSFGELTHTYGGRKRRKERYCARARARDACKCKKEVSGER
jgi:hypothetical protein